MIVIIGENTCAIQHYRIKYVYASTIRNVQRCEICALLSTSKNIPGSHSNTARNVTTTIKNGHSYNIYSFDFLNIRWKRGGTVVIFFAFLPKLVRKGVHTSVK